MNTRTSASLLGAGALGCLAGTTLLNWVSVNFLFATIGANAWRAGGIGPLATLLAVALVLGAGLVLLGEGAPVKPPPVGLRAVAGVLGLLAILPIVQGQAGAGAMVTLVAAGVSIFGAKGLPSPGAVAVRRRLPAARPSQASTGSTSTTGASRFCPSCGTPQEAGVAFCAQCGARLR